MRSYLDEEYEKIVFLNGDAPIRKCESCGHEGKDVVDTPSQTCYCWNGEGEDPNRDLVLCFECAYAYEAHMTDKWKEYYSMVM